MNTTLTGRSANDNVLGRRFLAPQYALASRFVPVRARYSRWDGTQVGFELDADSVLAEITDDLLYHGDLNAALRRLLQSGFRDRNDERIAGMRELLEKLRRKKRDELERYDLGGVYDDIAQELRDVVDMEREGIDQLQQRGPASRATSAARRSPTRWPTRRRMQLDLLPPDLAGQVKELQEYEFTSSEAREKFDELMEKLKQQLMQSYFNQMSGAMSDVSPEQIQRMKDMFNSLNRMLEQRERGEPIDPSLRELHAGVRRLLPRQPADARRVARADGPADGGHAGDAQLDDARAAGAVAGTEPRRCSRTWTCAGRSTG